MYVSECDSSKLLLAESFAGSSAMVVIPVRGYYLTRPISRLSMEGEFLVFCFVKSVINVLCALARDVTLY